MSVRVTEYTPSTVRPLDEVRPIIKAKLDREAAVRLARKAGEERLAQLRKEADDHGFEPVKDLARRDNQFIPAAAINTVMTLPADQLPAYVGVDQPEGGYALLHVLGVTSAPPQSDSERGALEKSWTERIASAEQAAYVQALRDRFGARVTRSDLSAPKARPVTP